MNFISLGPHAGFQLVTMAGLLEGHSGCSPKLFSGDASELPFRD